MRTRVSIPKSARAGDIIEIRAVAAHPMETGFRRDNVGKKVPRDILTQFICTFDDEELFRAELFPAIAANPYLSFFTTATKTGQFEFRWVDQKGKRTTVRKTMTVT